MHGNIIWSGVAVAKVSVIIVAYNAEDTILECLESLNGQSCSDFEAVLVDNDSKDSTRSIVSSFKPRARYPLKTVFSDRNTGFCLGNNLGLKRSSGSYIALLNPDARADANWLKCLVDAMDRNPEVGICGSKVLTWDRDRIDSAGDMMLSTFRAFKREADDPCLYETQEYVFGACAAGALYRREAIERIGFFDEDFFIQCDDTDLNFRFQIAGWKVLYVPSSKISHKVSASIGRASGIGVYYSQRNMEFVKIKNAPLSVLISCIPQMFMGYVADFLYFGVKHKMWKTFLKAKIDALRMAPLMLRKRKLIMREIKKADNRYIGSLITPLSVIKRDFIALKMRRVFKTHSPVSRPS